VANFGLIKVALAVGPGNHRQRRGTWSGRTDRPLGPVRVSFETTRLGPQHLIDSYEFPGATGAACAPTNTAQEGAAGRGQGRQRQRCEEVRDEPEHRYILYARVSSDASRRVIIRSRVKLLRSRSASPLTAHALEPEHAYVDDGYSGTPPAASGNLRGCAMRSQPDASIAYTCTRP